MNPAMPHERLTGLIARFATSAQETRQVSRRLADLLPSRFMEIRREVARRTKGGDADRLALTDERYLAAILELNEVSARAIEARIQYETHAMLYQARQSLRAFRR